MALTAANVNVAVTGSVYFAPAGTALPVTVDAALDAAFVDLGYISEDGVSTSNSVDTTDIVAWQNGDIVRKIQTGHDYTVAFTMLESNPATLELYYGNYAVGASTNGEVQVTGEQGFRGCFVLNIVDGTDLVRVVIPDGQVTDFDDVSYTNGDAIAYGVTITGFPDTSAVKAYIYYEAVGAS